MNMKIAIITPYEADNMGAMLQTLALKKYLESKGHETVHVRFRSDSEIWKWFSWNCPGLDINLLKYWARFIKHPIDNIRIFPNYINTIKRYMWIKTRKRIFREYLNRLPVVELYNNEKIDLYVLGSDEIWNVSSPLFRNKIFWGEGYTPSVVYAASMSGAGIEDFRKYPEYIKYFNNFDYITVRDQNTQNVLQTFTGFCAEKVVDPTLLVTKGIVSSKEEKKNWLLLYGYPSEWKKFSEYIKRFAREQKLKIVSLWFYLEFADKNILCTPEQFQYYLSISRYVVTNTFHGSVFSVLGETQFVTYSPKSKATELLEDLKQQSRIIYETDSYSDFAETLSTKCDYEETRLIIRTKQKESQNILDGMLRKYEKEYNHK